MSDKRSRRDFLKLAATSGVAAGVAPAVFSRRAEAIPLRAPKKPVAPNERLRIATIGMGIIGFIDTDTALRVPGTEFVAAADCYDPRLARTKEVYGPEVETTRDYREILARPDVDAVIVSTPDHWHAAIAKEAMEAGKHVYLEKPMVHDLEEGPEVIRAQQQTGRVLEVGSQFASSLVYDKARQLFEEGAIGELNMVQASYNRFDPVGAWQYSIPPGVSPENLDWEQFLGPAPEVPFDPVRFFRWRNYWDYGTGIPGDLYVHLLTGLHYVTGGIGPTQVMGMGGLRFWEDGREVPDVILGLYEYEERPTHPSFTLSLQANFADGSGGGQGLQLIGSEGSMTIGGDSVRLVRRPMRQPSLENLVEGYNSVRTFSEEVREEFVAFYRAQTPTPDRPQPSEVREFESPPGYDARLDHFVNFFDAIRDGGTVVEDAVFGYRAAAAAILTNVSYRQDRAIPWDPEAMRVQS